MNKLTEAFIMAIIQLLCVVGISMTIIGACIGVSYVFGGAGMYVFLGLGIILMFTVMNLEE